MIEPLPIAFKQRERIYRQLARKGIVALYEVRNFRHILIGFELIIVRYQPAKITDRWKFPERERYPTDREFGHYAWSLPNGSLPLAELAFDHLATTMAHNRSECVGRKDFYRIGYQGTGPYQKFYSIRNFMTGRRLPKTPHRSNSTPEPTERLSGTKRDQTTIEPQ